MSSNVEWRFGNLLAIKSTNCNVDNCPAPRAKADRKETEKRIPKALSGGGASPFFLGLSHAAKDNPSPLNCKSGFASFSQAQRVANDDQIGQSHSRRR